MEIPVILKRLRHPDPDGLPDRTPIKVGEVWENPVSRERATLLELPWENQAGRVTAELTALVGARVVGEHRHPALVERFTTLEGELTVKRNGQTSILQPGETAVIEPGVRPDSGQAISPQQRVSSERQGIETMRSGKERINRSDRRTRCRRPRLLLGLVTLLLVGAAAAPVHALSFLARDTQIDARHSIQGDVLVRAGDRGRSPTVTIAAGGAITGHLFADRRCTLRFPDRELRQLDPKPVTIGDSHCTRYSVSITPTRTAGATLLAGTRP